MFDWLLSKLDSQIVLFGMIVPGLILSLLAAAASAGGLNMGAVMGPVFAGVAAGFGVVLGVLGFMWGINRYAHRAFPLRILMGGFYWLTGLPLAIWLTVWSIAGYESNTELISEWPWGMPGSEDPRIQKAAAEAGEPPISPVAKGILEEWSAVVSIAEPNERMLAVKRIRKKLEGLGFIVP
jgi:hypothetical protein